MTLNGGTRGPHFSGRAPYVLSTKFCTVTCGEGRVSRSQPRGGTPFRFVFVPFLTSWRPIKAHQRLGQTPCRHSVWPQGAESTVSGVLSTVCVCVQPYDLISLDVLVHQWCDGTGLRHCIILALPRRASRYIELGRDNLSVVSVNCASWQIQLLHIY